MSNAESANPQSGGEISSTDDIINEVVENCKKLGLEDEKEVEDKVDDLERNEVMKDDDFVDEIYLKDLDVSSSQEDLQKRKKSAMECKDIGNDLFKNKDYENARKKYTEALRTCPLEYKEERAILYANRAAAKIKQSLKNEGIDDCTKALELNPNYVKALLRRAKLYEETNKLNDALEDYKKILQLDPGNSEARAATIRLPGQINEQNERLIAEMVGSLKEIGNKMLRPFGLSTDNFQVQQDPNSGGYSINFKQNQK